MFKTFRSITILLLAGSSMAYGSLITFTSQSAFNAATNSPTTFGFGGVAPTGSFTSFTTYNSNGVAFTAIGTTDVDVTSANYYGAGFLYPADFIVNAGTTTTPAGILLTFSAPITAIAFEIGSYSGGAILATASDSSTTSLSTTPTLGNVTFWGLISTTPITSLSLSNSDAQPAVYLTSVTLANSTAAPEPSTFALLGCALFRRRSAR
jgi:hypothetical protein